MAKVIPAAKLPGGIDKKICAGDGDKRGLSFKDIEEAEKQVKGGNPDLKYSLDFIKCLAGIEGDENGNYRELVADDFETLAKNLADAGRPKPHPLGGLLSMFDDPSHQCSMELVGSSLRGNRIVPRVPIQEEGIPVVRTGGGGGVPLGIGGLRGLPAAYKPSEQEYEFNLGGNRFPPSRFVPKSAPIGGSAWIDDGKISGEINDLVNGALGANFSGIKAAWKKLGISSSNVQIQYTIIPEESGKPDKEGRLPGKAILTGVSITDHPEISRDSDVWKKFESAIRSVIESPRLRFLPAHTSQEKSPRPSTTSFEIKK